MQGTSSGQLLKPNENDATVQILQAIFYSIFSIATKNGEGSFARGSIYQPHEMLQETKSVPKTNVVSETDFAQLQA